MLDTINYAQSLQIDKKMIAVNKEINKKPSISYLQHINRIDVRPVLPNANKPNFNMADGVFAGHE